MCSSDLNQLIDTGHKKEKSDEHNSNSGYEPGENKHEHSHDHFDERIGKPERKQLLISIHKGENQHSQTIESEKNCKNFHQKWNHITRIGDCKDSQAK